MFFTVGMSNYPCAIKGFEHLRFYCPRCHNVSMEAQKDHQFFTFCFIPLIPISFSKNLTCPICGYKQGTSKEQLEVMKNQQAGQAGGQQQPPPPQGYAGNGSNQGYDGKQNQYPPSNQPSQPSQPQYQGGYDAAAPPQYSKS